MGPWTFSLFQTTLSILPCTLVVWILGLLLPPVESLAGFGRGVDVSPVSEVETVAHRVLEDRIAPVLIGLSVPLYITLAAWAVAFASLTEGARPQRRRSRLAYLYLDGSYGLMPQTLLALGLGLMEFLEPRYEMFRGAASAAELVLLCGLVWQLYVTFYRIPSALFELNGFRRGIRWPWCLLGGKSAPYYQYWFIMGALFPKAHEALLAGLLFAGSKLAQAVAVFQVALIRR